MCGKVRKRDSKESITEDNDNGINDETVKRTTANKMKRHQHGSANSASLVSNQESPASSDQQDTMEISSQKKVVCLPMRSGFISESLETANIV